MTNITGSFARDWQFVKISRNWKPHDFSKEILEKIIEENDRDFNDRIRSIVFDIGKREGREIKNRLGDKMDIKTVIEGILLISGQDYRINDKNENVEITISKKRKNKEDVLDNPDLISVPYIRGVIKSIIPESQYFDSSDEVTILF